MLVLPNLLSGRELSKLFVIEHTIECPAAALVSDAVCHALNRNERVLFCVQDSTEARWKRAFEPLVGEKIGRMAWHRFRGGQAKGELARLVQAAEDILGSNRDSRVLVVFESLHFHHFRIPLADVARLLGQLLNVLQDRGRIVAQYHSDLPFLGEEDTRFVYDPAEVLWSVATSYVVLSNADSERSGNTRVAEASLGLKKPSGKIVHETAMVRWSGLKVLGIQPPAQAAAKSSAAAPMPESSFNLSLTEQQRAARDRVVLPFMKAQTEGYTIEYTAGSDEGEDPDGDLEV